MVTIDGTAFKQNDNAPWEFAFVESVKKIAPLCGVPRKEVGHEGGFQRALGAGRVAQIEKFFEGDENSSPTSIVIGLLEGNSTLEFVGEYGDDDLVRKAKLTIHPPEDDETIGEIVARMLPILEARIEEEADEEEADEEEVDEEEVDEEETDEEETEEENVDELDFGKSAITNLIELLSDDEWVANTDNHEFITDLGRPALVIDGQHRLLGADASVGVDIPFSFVAVVNATWPEMVFQFCMINKTSEPVNDDVVETNAALSLTNSESAAMGERLALAGIVDKGLDIMNRCYLTPGQPFEGRVKLSFHSKEQKKGKIGKGMVGKMARDFRSCQGPFLKKMRDKLYEGEGLKASERSQKWIDTGDWAKAFNTLWTDFKEHFETYEGGGEEPSGMAGDPFWGEANTNVNKGAVLQSYQRKWLESMGRKMQQLESLGIDLFDASFGDTPWEVFETFSKELLNGNRKLTTRRWLENRWSGTTGTHGDFKKLLDDYWDRSMNSGTMNWQTRAEFRPA